MNRPRYGQQDLDRLRRLDRAGVLAALGAVETIGLEPAAETLATAELLAPAAMPGLAAAVAGGEAAAVESAVLAACTDRARRADLPAPPVDAAVRAEAAAARTHRFRFYTETHQLPESIDWDHNPGTAHWGHDLNRFHFLEVLTAVARAGGPEGEASAAKALALILDWVDQCDLGLCFRGTPYVFGSYLNQAIHIARWARCLQHLLPAGQVDGRSLVRILRSLHEQLAYLEIVTHGHHGNWPTIGCQGMLQVLAAFPVFADQERWIDHAVDTLAAQIDEQVLPDGVQDELTPHYHAVVVGNLLTAEDCLQSLGRCLAPRTLHTLRAMLAYQQQTVVPSGRAQVAFNDSDPEVVPGPRRGDARLARLSLADALRADADLGPELYPWAGVAFLRQRAAAGDLYLAFDGGPFGRSHQHEDRLGFWLHAYGRDFVVDPGRHLYDRTEASFLPYLRTTAAHSTIRIDGQEQNARSRPATWIAGRPDDMGFAAGPTEARAQASYDLGYGPDNAIAVVHRREIVFAAQRFWVVFDVLHETDPQASMTERCVESRFQLAPGSLELDGMGRAWTGFDDANLLLWSTTDWDLEQVLCGRTEPRAGWYSPAYSRIEPAPCWCLEVVTRLPLRSATLLYPYRGSDKPDVSFGPDGDDGAVLVRSRTTGPVRVLPGQMWNT